MTLQADRASSTAVLLESNKNAILRNWEKQLLKNLPAARQQRKSALRDHVPGILDELVKTLEAGSIINRPEADEMALEHGRQRSFAGIYTLDQVLSEFQLLRKSIFDVIELRQPLDRLSREIILEYLECSISESATEYVKIQFHRERAAREAVETSARRLRGLQTVTEAALASDVSLDRLLFDLCERVRELFQADNAAILLVDRDRKYLEVRAASGLEAEVEKQPKVPVGQGMAGTVFASLQSRIINDLSQTSVINQMLRASVKSVLTSPLRLVDKPIGVLHVDRVQKHEFSEDDLTLLELIADRIAIVIEHTTLNERQRENEARLKLVSEGSPDILWNMDAVGNVIYINENWYTFTGLPQPTSGSQWLEAVHPEDRMRMDEAWTSARATGAYCVEIRMRDRGGGYRWFLSRAVPVRDSVGAITQWVGSSTDIEEQKRYQLALEEEREQREYFVNTLTHDLRTPLSAAMMSSGVIERQPDLSEKVRGLAARVTKSLRRVDRMIQGLLDVSRIRAGKELFLKIEECDLRKLVQETVEDLSEYDRARTQVIGPGSLAVTCGKAELRRALENLLSNAIKYGDSAAPITITLSEDDRNVSMGVHNFGAPIPPEELPAVFEPFGRTKSARSEGKKGWGLGLYLIHGVAKAHQGSVSARSDSISGTTFTINLPKAPRA